MVESKVKRDKMAFVAIALGMAVMCGIGALMLFVLSTPPKPPGPPLYPELLIYPGATDVEIVTGSKLPQHPSLALERLITFMTDAKPEAVLAFYEDTLKKEGWRLFEKISPTELGFYWTDGTAIGGLYKVNVTTGPSIEGGTQVTVEAGQGADVR